MRIVPTNINTSTNLLLKNTDFYINDTVPANDTLQGNKPLPKVPHPEIMHISPLSGSFEETPYYDDHQPPYYPYYYPYQQQEYHYPQPVNQQQQQQQNVSSDLPPNCVSISCGSEWKMASKNDLQRSDSLKIETVTVPAHRFSNPLQTHMEKPHEAPLEEKKRLCKKMSKQEVDSKKTEAHSRISLNSTSSSSEAEDSSSSFSAAENNVEQPNSLSASSPTLLHDQQPVFYDHMDHRFSIASCSLINDKSNLKLYRRMAIKTHCTETQLAYAKYLMQISKLYNHSFVKCQNQAEPPSQIRHRLLTEAGYWIERLAKSGIPEALHIQGKWYMLGPQAEDCVIYNKVHETKAMHCFIRASGGGWADAHYELANIWKTKKKFKRAVYYYDIGAKDNHTLSIYKMAKILLRGQLKVNKDINKGLAYLLRAANMNDPESSEPAYVVACIYAKQSQRIGIDRYVDDKPIESFIEVDGYSNDSLALKYLKKSAHYGCVDAIYFMAQTFEKGMLGQTLDLWQAYQYYMKAAEMNHPEAMLDLSRMYYQGIPEILVSQKDFAFKWCKRSADLGFDRAEYVLGQYYEDGVGVLPNFPLALEYFGKAASKGYKLAAQKLNRPTIEVVQDNRSIEQVHFFEKKQSR